MKDADDGLLAPSITSGSVTENGAPVEMKKDSKLAYGMLKVGADRLLMTTGMSIT